MAIIKRSKVSVYGLPEDLAALTAVDVAEQAARIAGDLAEKTRSEAAELVLRTDLASEAARAIAVEADLQAQINAKEAALIAADAAQNLRINNVLNNVDGIALNSLAEVVTAFQAADGTLNGAITALAGAAGADLTTEISRATTAEGVLTTNLTAETVARIAADTALDTSLKAFATESVRVGGAMPEMETLTVAGSKIVLTNAPKNGVKGIIGYGRVSYVDINNVENLAPVTLDSSDVSGKTFIINTDAANEWDAKTVQIQYWYITAA
jgi:hypothetical protein